MRATPLLRISTDDTLARRTIAGDEDAYALLYDRYRVRLEAYCRGILRHDEDARDAAQNALASALQALRRGTEPANVRPWLFRIAHNEAISILRRRRVGDELPETLAGDTRGPADALELREELTAVLDAVKALAPGARSALLLRELAGLEYPEVAQVLGTTPGGARQAVFEARVALEDDRVGRGTDCDVIRHELSVHDGRRRHSRRIRGHLRGCTSCRDWSQAQRQRRQRLALGSLPLPFFGWLAGAFGGLAGVGTGASVSGGLAAQTQALTALAVVAVGATPAVIEHQRGGDRPDRDRDTAAATTAARPPAGPPPATPLTSSAGPARLASTTGAPPRGPISVAYRATPARPGAAGDGGSAERRRSGRVERTDARGTEGDRPAGERFSADAEDRRDRRGTRWDRDDADDSWRRRDREERRRDDDSGEQRRQRHDRDRTEDRERPPRRQRERQTQTPPPGASEVEPAPEQTPEPKPTPTTESKPASEPTPTSEPKPAAQSQPEPVGENAPEPEPEPAPEPQAEPA